MCQGPGRSGSAAFTTTASVYGSTLPWHGSRSQKRPTRVAPKGAPALHALIKTTAALSSRRPLPTMASSRWSLLVHALHGLIRSGLDGLVDGLGRALKLELHRDAWLGLGLGLG